MELLTILFLVLTLLYFSFLILFFLAAGQESLPTGSLIDYPVSIVVAAHNSRKNLEQLLGALNKQLYSNVEIIIIDDRSTDGTRDFLKQQKEEFSFLKVISIDVTPKDIDPKKYALTLGIKTARNDIILLTDADCLPYSPSWISGMASGFSDHKQIVLGFSSYEKRPGLLNYFIRFETIFTGIQYLSSALLGNPYMGVGRNLAYRKSFFLDKKGFSEFQNVTGGDDDLFINRNGRRSNTAVVMGKDFLTISQPKETLKAYLNQKLRHLSVGKGYRWKDKILLGLFNLSYLGSLIITTGLIIKSPALLWLASFLIVRWGVMMIVFGRWGRILGSPINVLGMPILDILYLFYFIFTGIRALFIKKVKWT